MSTTWFERFLRPMSLGLQDGSSSTVVAELQSCGAETLHYLQETIARLEEHQPPDENVCATLDSLIADAHAMMASPSQSTGNSWRRLYSDACILRSLADIRAFFFKRDTALAMSCISRLDHAIVIAGAPGEGRLDLILDLISEVQSRCLNYKGPTEASVFPITLPGSHSSEITMLKTAMKSVPRLEVPPSLASFISLHSRHPFVLPGYVREWPAMNEHPWKSLDYLRSVAGPGRVVPVEIGSDYRDDDWSQEMMSWDAFLDALDPQSDKERRRSTLYLAQHNLLMQLPKLREDIQVPDYVYASLPPPDDFPDYIPPRNEDQLVLNVWLGPSGTVSPAHTDPYYNFYAQIVGRKTVWLAPPSVSSMYPFPPPSPSSHASDHTHNPAANNTNPSMSNTSRVDVFQTAGTEETMPLFWREVVPQAMAVTLQPGDLLFFPPGWWHAMRSEETSFSVSMWF